MEWYTVLYIATLSELCQETTTTKTPKMIAHVTSLEICEISIYLPSILVFVFNLIAISFAFVLDTLFSFFLPIIFLFANCTSHASKGNESNPSWYGSLEQPNLHPVCSEDGWESLHRVLQRERVWNKPLNEFLHSTDLKDQLLVVNEVGGGKRGGGKGKDGGFNEGSTGGTERGSVVAKKV